MKGYFSLWNQRKHFGIISVKKADSWVDRYFALESQIIRREVEPDFGVLVEFNETKPAQKPGDYPVALNIQVLAPEPAKAEKVEPKAGV